ncbi:MAG TPA: hypothetical protein VKU84_17680 [Stellaceae bacterium]|nr:hypothetical protein [Stellaceae bacterium]
MTEMISPVAPDRESRLAALAFAAGAGPTAWSAHIVTNYALASRLCFSGREPLLALHGGSGAWVVMLAVDLLAVAICGAGTLVSSGFQRETRGPQTERTLFVARCGLLSGAGFAVATLFDTIALFMVPLCAT